MSAASRVRPRATIGWRDRLQALYGEGESERGAVLVEAAFVFPVFLLLLFGMIEFGFIFKDSLNLSSMVQVGARTGAVIGNGPDADYDILTTMAAGSQSLGATINYVIVFDANNVAPGTGDGTPAPGVPTQCVSTADGGGTGVAGLCNIYTQSEWHQIASGQITTPAEISADFNGTASGWDGNWAPSGRAVSTQSNNQTGPDYLGIYISAAHKTLTGFFPSVTLHETDIIRLEPQSFS